MIYCIVVILWVFLFDTASRFFDKQENSKQLVQDAHLEGKSISLLMASRRFHLVSMSGSGRNDASDSYSSNSDSPDSLDGSGFSSDAEAKSAASRGFSKGSMPLDSPLLDDELETCELLGGDNIHDLTSEDVRGLG